jgi:argininosuccinate lyase
MSAAILGREMRRRDFIKVIAGSAVALPLAARAQQTAMPAIGYLQSASPSYYAQFIGAVSQGLKEAGIHRRSERGDRTSLGGRSL